MFRKFLAVLLLALAAGPVACGGGGGGGGGDEASSFEKLQAIPGEIQAEYDKLFAPIDSADKLVTQIAEVPKKLNMDVPAFNDFVAKLLNGEVVEVPNVADEGKKTLDDFVAEIKAFQAAIAGTPDQATKLVETCVAKLAEAPALAAAVSAESQIVAANPFASAEDKAKAKTQAAEADKVKDNVSKTVGEMQTKVTGLPAQAAAALQKLQKALVSL